MSEMITLITIVIFVGGLCYEWGHSKGYYKAREIYREYLREKYNDINLFIDPW